MNRDFKGIWIPREIWLNKKLSIQAKALWSEIWSLHNRDSGGCFASNEYLCEFMNVKLSRLKEIMKELRDEKLIIEVSFDGRYRVVRANLPEVEYGGQQTAGIPASSQPVFRPSDSRNPGRPSYILENSIEISRENTSLKVSEGQSAYSLPDEEKSANADMFALANEVDLINPPIEVSIEEKPKKKKITAEFSKNVRDVASKMLKLLEKHNPVYRPPADLSKFLYQVSQMLEVEKQEPEVILEAFEWAVSDNEDRGNFKGWQSVIVTNKKSGKVTNPAEIFRGHLSKIHSQMLSRPKRRFGACSDTNEAVKGMKNMETI